MVVGYPILDIFWTTLIVMGWILFFIILFQTFAHIMRNRTMGGLSKALWVLLVVFIPFLGILLYIVIHGNDIETI